MDIKQVLQKLQIEPTGYYENNFYIINLSDSDEYAKIYSKLDENAINTEYPAFKLNTNKSLDGIVNYFEISVNNINYLLFLFANFDTDTYYLKITEQ